MIAVPLAIGVGTVTEKPEGPAEVVATGTGPAEERVWDIREACMFCEGPCEIVGACSVETPGAVPW